MIALVLCPVKGKAPYPPLAICALKAWLKESGISSTAIDLNNNLKNTNLSLFHKYDMYFGRPKTYLDTDNIDDFSNLDTIYNFRLLLLFLSFQESETNGLTQEELIFFTQLNKQIESDASTLISSGFKYIGFSAYVSNICYAILLSRKLKKINKDIKIFFGGSSTAYKQIRDFLIDTHIADFIVVGEGERAIVKLIQDLNSNKANYRTIFSENIAPTSISEDEIVVPIIQDINELPFPDFSDFDLSKYSLIFNKKHRFATIASSRGCVYRCAYCSETQYWFRFRQRDVIRVVEEIEHLHRTYDTNVFFFCDSLINGNTSWLLEFCNKIISKKLNILWMSYATISNLNKDLLLLMAKSGCVSLTLGIEHISSTVLKGVNKKSSIGDVKGRLLECIDAGIFPVANIIYALPNEKDSDFLELLSFVSDNELKNKVLFTFRPYEIRVGSVVTQNLFDSSNSFHCHEIMIPPIYKNIEDTIKELSKYWLPEEQYITRTKLKRSILRVFQESNNSNHVLRMENVRNYKIKPVLNKIISKDSIPSLLSKNNFKETGFQEFLITLINGKNKVSDITDSVEEIILKNRSHLTVSDIHQVALQFVKQNLIDLTLKHQILWI